MEPQLTADSTDAGVCHDRRRLEEAEPNPHSITDASGNTVSGIGQGSCSPPVGDELSPLLLAWAWDNGAGGSQ